MEEKELEAIDLTELSELTPEEEPLKNTLKEPSEDASDDIVIPLPEDSWDKCLEDVTLNAEPSEPLLPKQNTGITIRKSHLIIGVAVALALVVGGFFLGYFLKSDNNAPLSEQEAEYVQADPMKPDPNAKPYGDVQAFPENPTPGNIIMPGYSELRMHADTNLLKSVWINSEGNSCYLRFTLRLSDTGETLYQSGLIAPGLAVDESVLTHSLARGEYEVEIVIEAFSMTENPTPLNSVKEMSVKLYAV